MFERIALAALLLGGSGYLRATTVSIGQVVLSTDGVSGNYALGIQNLTGAGNCSSVYEVCDAVNFINWSLTVAFNDGTTFSTISDNSTYYVGGSPIEPWLGTDFTIGVPTAPWTIPLCQDSLLDCPATLPLWTITSVEFTGEVDTTPLLNFFGGPTTFVPSTFSASFTPDAPDAIGQAGAAFYYFASDISLTDTPAGPGGGGTVPEPGAMLMVATGIATVAMRHRRRRTA